MKLVFIKDEKSLNFKFRLNSVKVINYKHELIKLLVSN